MQLAIASRQIEFETYSPCCDAPRPIVGAPRPGLPSVIRGSVKLLAFRDIVTDCDLAASRHSHPPTLKMRPRGHPASAGDTCVTACAIALLEADEKGEM